MYQQIVVGIDGSACSDHALIAACELADAFDAHLTLVHSPQSETMAVPVGSVAGYHELVTVPTKEELVGAGEAVVDAAMKKVREHGCTADTEIRIGDPATEILAVADARSADLVVCGRRGHGVIAGILLGSTSQKVQHRAECACLTVP